MDIEINHEGIAALLREEGVRQDLDRRAKRIAAAAGPGMESSSVIGRRRALAMVWTETPSAMRAEATSRKLTRAVDAGRG